MSYFLSWHLFTCLIKYKHISDCCEHENTVFIAHINAYLNHILALGYIWARTDIKAYFWSYFRRVSTRLFETCLVNLFLSEVYCLNLSS
jgi:hypothetical protein